MPPGLYKKVNILARGEGMELTTDREGFILQHDELFIDKMGVLNTTENEYFEKVKKFDIKLLNRGLKLFVIKSSSSVVKSL